MGLDEQNTSFAGTSHFLSFFLHFLTSLYDCDVKILNLAFYRGRDQNKTIFSEVRYSPQTSNQAKLTTFGKLKTAE